MLGLVLNQIDYMINYDDRYLPINDDCRHIQDKTLF